MTWISTGRPKARIPHRCCLCNRQIQPGERYERGVCVDDWGVRTCKTCAHCQSMWEALRADPWSKGIDWYADDLDAEETIVEWEPTSLAGLRLKALWRKKWQRADGTLYPVPEVVS